MTVTIPLTETNLFKPISIGDVKLNHRIVHAPTSRKRSTKDNYPTDLMIDYYKSRSQYPGSFIIFESCLVSERSGLVPHKIGLWDEKHCLALKQIVDEVHNNNCVICCQIMANGRTSNAKLMQSKNLPILAPSITYPNEAAEKLATELNFPIKPLTVDEIHNIQDDFVNAAVNSLKIADFDFVELHATSGFLIEQFLSPLSNKRTDEYGGDLVNRCRFLIEIIDKFINHPDIGPKKFGVRISPWYSHNGMVYPEEVNLEDGIPYQFCQYILKQLEVRKSQGNEISYVSIVEPRVSGNSDVDSFGDKSNDEIIKSWSGKLIRAGGYATNFNVENPTLIKTNKQVTNEGGEIVHYANLINDVNNDDRTLIGFSRPFTSNPDLVYRLENNLKLEYYDRPTFYTQTGEGYLTFKNYDGSAVTKLPEKELMREGILLQ